MRVLEKPAVEEGSAEAKRDQGPHHFSRLSMLSLGFASVFPEQAWLQSMCPSTVPATDVMAAMAEFLLASRHS